VKASKIQHLSCLSKKGEDENDENNRKLSKNKCFTYRGHSATKKNQILFKASTVWESCLSSTFSSQPFRQKKACFFWSILGRKRWRIVKKKKSSQIWMFESETLRWSFVKKVRMYVKWEKWCSVWVRKRERWSWRFDVRHGVVCEWSRNRGRSWRGLRKREKKLWKGLRKRERERRQWKGLRKTEKKLKRFEKERSLKEMIFCVGYREWEQNVWDCFVFDLFFYLENFEKMTRSHFFLL